MGSQKARSGTFAGLNLYPRKRRTPMKRYKVLATFRYNEDGTHNVRTDTCFLILRARSKRNACFFAMESYQGIIHAEVITALGRSMDESERIDLDALL